ncbi:hypothetical protein [Blastococcus saxobsidens]|uniref:hypothetical protein n=1 Tax=Blastococcus saxobsidens TaxID=138336 RepID=UPI000CEB941C|nr:hypothetical protein [Blastococcus saxobsidens]
MSTPPIPAPPLEAPPGPAPHRDVHWRGWPEVRQDLGGGLGVFAALAVSGVPAGVLWWLLAPRADYRVTADGPVAVGLPAAEVPVGVDSVLLLVLLGLGVLAGGLAWLRRRTRGVGMLVVLTLGATLAAVGAWQVGALLGQPPTEAELTAVGSTVTTGLGLRALPVLAGAPFAALLTYLACVLVTADDGLGRESG